MIPSRLLLVAIAAACGLSSLPTSVQAAPVEIPILPPAGTNGKGPTDILTCLLTGCFFNGGATFDCPCEDSNVEGCVNGIQRGFRKFPKAKEQNCKYAGPGRR